MPYIRGGIVNDLFAQLARIERKMDYLLRASVREEERDTMAQRDIDKLKAQVEKNGSVTQSAVTLITGLAEQIRAAQDDPAELEALANSLNQQAENLAAAVTANTPAPQE
jgi:chromosome segregation ATPase